MTGFGVCELSMIPVRKSTSETSEMVNQLLFGDLVNIMHDEGSWLLIKSDHDGYEGWIDQKMLSIINEEEFKRLQDSSKYYLKETTAAVKRSDNSMLSIVMGSVIHGRTGNGFSMGENSYTIDAESISEKVDDRIEILMDLTNSYLNAPYLWGGRSPMGIDCSGFVQIVFKMIGISLYRDASQQAEQGTMVNFIEEAMAGDLVFFDNEESKITHVGILLNNNQIIHASGYVRIDTIDHHGIYREHEKKYSHKLRLIKRVID